MPIYEYVCQSCQHRFEVKQKMSDEPLSSCPRCGQPVSKVISAPGLMFKGSGWYVTDYSDKMKPPADAKAETPAKDGNGKPDQKPATTTPAPSGKSDSGKTDSGKSDSGKSDSGKSDSSSGSSSGTGSGGGSPAGSSTPTSSTPASSS